MSVIFRHRIWLEQPVWPQMFCVSVNGEVETPGLQKSIGLSETFQFAPPTEYLVESSVLKIA